MTDYSYTIHPDLTDFRPHPCQATQEDLLLVDLQPPLPDIDHRLISGTCRITRTDQNGQTTQQTGTIENLSKIHIDGDWQPA